MRSAGGLPPLLAQCHALWNSLGSAVEQWGVRAFDNHLSPEFVRRNVMSGAEVLKRLESSYAFVSAERAPGTLCAVAINREGAARYAAARLHQDKESLGEASDLFLKLMAEQPAQWLWASVTAALARTGTASTDLELADPSAVPERIEPDERYLCTAVTLASEGNEDGWLLEGGDDAPELQLVMKLSGVTQFVHDSQRLAESRKGQAPVGQDTLRKSLRGSTIRLDAILEQVSLTLADCSRLEVGQVLELPGVEPGKLSLCAETMNGNVTISHGELGTWKGRRALKLRAPILDSFVREIAEI